MTVDHLLMIGFGGPTKPEEIRPFLEVVTRGVRIPEERLQAVAHHYEAVGGRSPYNEHTIRLFGALREQLRAQGMTLPMFLGMRNWHPFLKDTLADVSRRGLRQGLGLVLAPHRSFASFGKYVKAIDEAKAEANTPDLAYAYLEPWFEHPLFIEAQADQARKVLRKLTAAARSEAHLVFTAHSIPVEVARESQYAEEFARSSELVAGVLGTTRHHLAYQSRSGDPRQPWLEPDLSTVLKQLAGQGVRTVVVVPIGFLCDNVEVLFDLDLEAKQEAKALGLAFHRASTVMDHPKFVAMWAALIRQRLAAPAARAAA